MRKGLQLSIAGENEAPDIEWDGVDLPGGWVEAFRYLQTVGQIAPEDVAEKLKLDEDFNLEECMTWWSYHIKTSEMEIVRQNNCVYHLISYRSLQRIEAELKELYGMLDYYLAGIYRAI